jgi:hypothetical protein
MPEAGMGYWYATGPAEIAAPVGRIYLHSEGEVRRDGRKPPLCEAPGATAGDSGNP